MRYAAFYEGKKIEVEAESSVKAKVAAADLFKARKRYNVAVVLIEKEGKPVPVATSAL